MDMEFLKRLYMACSDDNAIFKAGMNLCELYQRLDDVEAADRDFTNTLDAAKLPFPVENCIVEASAAENIAYELQGFVNGFRLAMRIAMGKAVA